MRIRNLLSSKIKEKKKDILKDHQQAERYYSKVLNVNPNDSLAKKGLEKIKDFL